MPSLKDRIGLQSRSHPSLPHRFLFVMTIRSLLAVFTLFGLTTPASGEPSEPVDFARDISPILSNNCYFCHGPDPDHRKAGLRLDERDVAIDFRAIVPEQVSSSELVARIEHEAPQWIMPPPDSHKTLSKKEKDLLKRWIAEGAPYAKHWSFTPIKRPEVPKGAAEKVTNPIDAFVRERLRSVDVDLSPRSRADRLVRRLSLDLIGLPPTPEQVEVFVQDSAVNFDAAFQDLLDELFASVHHGERMASFWLDVVRYSDTVGYHGDQNQNVFPYRDWVVDAFNDNMPFDEFTRKQLAGDLLPGATTDDLLASCFNRLNMMTREGGAQPGEYLSKYTADRVRTVGMAWMGITTGCAECHDHKFDPFTTKDFYSLGAFFADLKQWGVYSDYGYTPNPDLRGYRNDYPFPPEIEVVSDALVREQRERRGRLGELARDGIDDLDEESREQARRGWDQLKDWLTRTPTGWQSLSTRASTDTTGKEGKEGLRRFVADRRSLTLDGYPALTTKEVRVRLGVPSDGKVRSLKIEFFVQREDKSIPIKVVQARANRLLPDFANGEIRDDVTGQWKFPSVDRSGRAIGLGEFQYFLDDTITSGEPNAAVYQFEKPLVLNANETLRIDVSGGQGLELEWHISPVAHLRPFDPVEIETLATAEDLKSSPASLAYMLTRLTQLPMGGEAKRLINEYHRCRDGRTHVMVSQASEPKTMRVLPRGNWQNQSGDIVEPAVPEFLQSDDSGGSGEKRKTRLDLADWILSPDNPLTARVVVNRLWKQFFGRGITEAVDDLGAQGDPPSHPKLLDYLAGELIASDWNIRHIVRLIVSSQTYQQDSRVREELAEVDPENRLLSFHPARRLEAEAVRDNALAISGLLNRQVGGPPVKPYQPAGYYSNLQFPNRTYQSTVDDDQYRRGLYMHWQRTFLHPMLANFDAPSREDCVAIRAIANTPQQALTLLNDPTFIEAAGQFAWNTLVDHRDLDDEAKIHQMIRQSVQREATSQEVDRLRAFLNEQRQRFADDPARVEQLVAIGQTAQGRDWSPLGATGGRSEWAAWTATARVLLNLHETITRY